MHAPALAALIAGAAVVGACATGRDPTYARQVALVSPAGQSIGTVSMWESPGAVSMRVQASGVPLGLHGIHVHAVGRCVPPSFESAGGHWNPLNRSHGFNDPQGPHAGDLPNITVSGNGVVNEVVVLSGASLSGLGDGDGSALVIHATADDYVTDPSGNSGARIACAVLAPAA